MQAACAALHIMEADTPGQAEPERSHDAKVQEALESMLSKKNLAKDSFLASKMNQQMYIPITVLLSHSKLEGLGATQEQVAAVAARSKRLSPDAEGTMVRPVLKSKRNVIILRDVPDNTTEEEILTLLKSGPHADQIASVKAEVNNTWFLKYNGDDGTQEVVLWLRSQLFKGKPLNAAIKSDLALRSFYPNNGQNIGFVPPGGPPGHEFGHMPPHMNPGMPPPEFVPGMGYPMQGKGGHYGMSAQGPGRPDSWMMPPGMHMPPQQMQMGLQCPGYWKPWGVRSQPPPLVFSSDAKHVPRPESSPPPWQKGGKWKGGKEDPGYQPGAAFKGKGDGKFGKGKKGGKPEGAKSSGKEGNAKGKGGVQAPLLWTNEASSDPLPGEGAAEGQKKKTGDSKMQWVVKPAQS